VSLSSALEDTPLKSSDEALRNLPRLLPTDSPDGIAALLVFPSGQSVSCNGIPLGPGAHVLQHTDRIDMDTLTFWVASSSAIAVTNYDSTIHGPDVFCFITKARLKPGEDIISCPGCAIIYRQAAWQMAIESDPRFRCPGCRFDPFGGDWKPELSTTSSLDRILDLARSKKLVRNKS